MGRRPGRLADADVDHGVEMLFEHAIDLKLWEAISFESNVREIRKNAGIFPKEWPYLYVSDRRPFAVISYVRRHGFGDETESAVLNVDVKGRPVGMVYRKQPLPLDVIESYELRVPFDAWKLALADLAAARRKPVELGVVERNGEPAVYLVFKNPRGVWQVSHFSEAGPTGHFEADDVHEAVKQGISDNLRQVRLDPGLLDEWAPNFTFVGALAGFGWSR